MVQVHRSSGVDWTIISAPTPPLSNVLKHAGDGFPADGNTHLFHHRLTEPNKGAADTLGVGITRHTCVAEVAFKHRLQNVTYEPLSRRAIEPDPRTLFIILLKFAGGLDDAIKPDNERFERIDIRGKGPICHFAASVVVGRPV